MTEIFHRENEQGESGA